MVHGGDPLPQFDVQPSVRSAGVEPTLRNLIVHFKKLVWISIQHELILVCARISGATTCEGNWCLQNVKAVAYTVRQLRLNRSCIQYVSYVHSPAAAHAAPRRNFLFRRKFIVSLEVSLELGIGTWNHVVKRTIMHFIVLLRECTGSEMRLEFYEDKRQR